MKWFAIAFVVLLMVLHQDFWWWNDTTLVFGFIPIGLAYHALIALLAGVAWALVVTFAWPTELEEEALAAAAQRTEERRAKSE
jgi:hypothetical protein